MEVPTLLKNKHKKIIVLAILFLVIVILTIFYGKNSMNINFVAIESFIFSLMLTSKTEIHDYRETLLLTSIVIIGITIGAIILSSITISVILAAIGGSAVCVLVKIFLDIAMS